MPASHAFLSLCLTIAAYQETDRWLRKRRVMAQWDDKVRAVCMGCQWRRHPLPRPVAARVSADHIAVFRHEVQLVR